MELILIYSELSDDDKEMYLDVLREAPILPFSNFVSRGDKVWGNPSSSHNPGQNWYKQAKKLYRSGSL